MFRTSSRFQSGPPIKPVRQLSSLRYFSEMWTRWVHEPATQFYRAYDIKKRLLENYPEIDHAETNVIAVWRHKPIGRQKTLALESRGYSQKVHLISPKKLSKYTYSRTGSPIDCHGSFILIIISTKCNLFPTRERVSAINLKHKNIWLPVIRAGVSCRVKAFGLLTFCNANLVASRVLRWSSGTT